MQTTENEFIFGRMDADFTQWQVLFSELIAQEY